MIAAIEFIEVAPPGPRNSNERKIAELKRYLGAKELEPPR
jgi:hypothetical protein